MSSPTPTPTPEKTNPITAEELELKLKAVTADKQESAEFQEQLAIKYRTEMQHVKYVPPEKWKYHPSLQESTDEDLGIQPSPSSSQVNTEIGETKLTEDQVNTADTTTVVAAQQAADSQEHPVESIKG